MKFKVGINNDGKLYDGENASIVLDRNCEQPRQGKEGTKGLDIIQNQLPRVGVGKSNL